MMIIHKMILKSYIPLLLLGLMFFVLIIILVDMFANLWRYLQNESSLIDILLVSWFYLPKAISFSLPPALLFASAFTIGSFQARNELLALFSSGISLFKFTTPLIILSSLFCFGSFYFNEFLVIDSLKHKNLMSGDLIGRSSSVNNTNVVVRSDFGRIYYQVDFYNTGNQSITGVNIIIRNQDMNYQGRIRSEWAEYKDGMWHFHKARVFSLDEKNQIQEQFHQLYTDEQLKEPPESFKRQVADINELSVGEARRWIDILKRTGNDRYQEVLTDYYQRFSFSLTPLIVTILSLTVSGYFKKNIMLMSILFSLIISVLYYVTDMVLVLFAKQGAITAITGAWSSTVIFLGISLALLRIAKS